MAFQFQSPTLVISLVSLLLVAQSHTFPTIKSAKAKKSVSIFAHHPATALTSKIHRNSFLASAYQLPYGVAAYTPMAALGMGAGLTSYTNNYVGHANPLASPYTYGGAGGYLNNYYAPVYPGAHSASHESYYNNHMGFPNGYSVNSKASYVPTGYGYAALGGRKTKYDKVKSHPGGISRVSGVNYSGHDGLSPYNFGTHEEHVAVPGMRQVTYTQRYPVMPAYGMYPYGAYGAMNGY